MELSNREIARYSRQIILPGVGVGGQKKLKASKVLIVGAGGLGCPVASNLAGAGIGNKNSCFIDDFYNYFYFIFVLFRYNWNNRL